MKKLLILLAVCIAVTACKKEDKAFSLLDSSATLSLNGATASPLASTKSQFPTPYTVQIIAEYAWTVTFQTPAGADDRGIYSNDIEAGTLSIGRMYDVVKEDGNGNFKLGILAVGVTDMLFRAAHRTDDNGVWWHPDAGGMQDGGAVLLDTIAYVPNATIRTNEAAMAVAFETGNYVEVLRILEEDYPFVPIENGAAWRKLKADGVE